MRRMRLNTRIYLPLDDMGTNLQLFSPINILFICYFNGIHALQQLPCIMRTADDFTLERIQNNIFNDKTTINRIIWTAEEKHTTI